MKTINSNPKLNVKLAGLALAGLLPFAAQAHDGRGPGANVSGEVQVTHEIPGGVISVGAVFGRQPQPQVVVVQPERRPDVVVIEKGHGRGWEHAHKRERQVTIIHEEPRREVTIIRHEAPRTKTVVVERPACDRPGYTQSHEWSDGRQVSVDRQGPAGNYHYYSDGNQVSEDKQGPNGNYHYYEDAHQVSIQDNRDGQQRNVYVRK